MLGRVLLIAAAIAMTLSACGGDGSGSATPTVSTTATSLPTSVPPSPTSTDDAVTYATAATDNERVVALLESGYTADGGQISGGVMLHNRNRTEAVVATYSVTLVYGGSDHLVVMQNVVLLPDQTLGDAFSATYAPPDTRPAVKISALPSDRWVTFSSPDRLTVTTTSSGTQLTGTVANPFAEATGPLRLSFLARQADGRIIDGQAKSLESIPAGGSEEINAGASASVSSIEAHVSFANDLPSWAAAP